MTSGIIGAFQEVRCSSEGVLRGKACHMLLFRLPSPFVLEVKCPRCRNVMTLHFDPGTGLPKGAPSFRKEE